MIIDRKIAPPVKEISNFNIVRAEKLKLSNGVEVYSLNTDQSGMVKIEWMFPAGNWYQSSPMEAFAVNAMLAEGTRNHTSLQLAEKIEYYGAQTGFHVDKDNAFVSILCQVKHLPEVLPIVNEMIREASFPENELEIFRKKHKQNFTVEHSKIKNYARYVHARMLFGNHHPYGNMFEPEIFDAINREQLSDFYQKNYIVDNSKIILSGCVTDGIITQVESLFGAKGQRMEARPYPQFETKTENELHVNIDRPETVQSAVRLGKILFNKTHPDFTAMSVLNCILGGYFGSRLMKTIREEKGYTYGINSLLVSLKHAGYLTIVSELGADVTQAAITDIYSEIEKLRNEPIPTEELSRVKNYMLGDMVRMFDGAFAQADSLISILENGLGYEYYEQMITDIKNITSEQLQALAQKYLDPSSFSQVVVGKINN
jgi:predicted Zn-dependent peptidase